MTVTPKQLAQIAVTTSVATAYTTPSSSTTVVKKAAFCNTSGGAVTLFGYIVPASGSAGSSNEVIGGVSVAAGATYVSSELSQQVLTAGMTLQFSASGAGITATISGVNIQ